MVDVMGVFKRILASSGGFAKSEDLDTISRITSNVCQKCQ